MNLDVLVLNSGEWVLVEELPASPWYVLIYRQRREPRNELHLWLPRQNAPRSGDYAFRRYWLDEAVRWCVEVSGVSSASRIRFTSPDGTVLWADHPGAKGLGDLSDYDLCCLLDAARPAPHWGF